MNVMLEILVLFAAAGVGVALIAFAWRIASMVQTISHWYWRSDDWLLGREGNRDFLHWYFRLFGIAWLIVLGAFLVWPIFG